MSGAMRRIGEYLGLLEDTRYDDDYDGDYETSDHTPSVTAGRTPRPTAAPASVSDLAERRRPAAGPT
jgi:cell division inhibitor SepF